MCLTKGIFAPLCPGGGHERGGRYDPTTDGVTGGGRTLVGSGAAWRHRHTLRPGRAPAAGHSPGGIDPAIRRLRPGRRRVLDSRRVRGHPRGDAPLAVVHRRSGRHPRRPDRLRPARADRDPPSLPHRRLGHRQGHLRDSNGHQTAQGERGEWAMIFGGALSVLFGVILAVIGPVAGLFSLIWLIGIYALAFGIMILITAFSVRARDSGSADRPSRVV